MTECPCGTSGWSAVYPGGMYDLTWPRRREGEREGSVDKEVGGMVRWVMMLVIMVRACQRRMPNKAGLNVVVKCRLLLSCRHVYTHIPTHTHTSHILWVRDNEDMLNKSSLHKV